MTIRDHAARLRYRVRHRRTARQPEPAHRAGTGARAHTDIDAQEPLRGEDSVDVRRLLETYTIEQLSAAAEEYYRRNAEGAEYYLAKPATTIDEAPELLISFAQVLAGVRPVRGMRVLDFGAGTGWTSRFLAQLGCEVVVCDVSSTALEMARRLFERQPVAGAQPAPVFLPFDGHRIDLPDESIDRVVCIDSFHHVPNPSMVLRELGRVLKRGGIAGFQEPGPNHSRMTQSQFEMKNFVVIENDILMRDIERWSHAAGFTSLTLAVFSSHPFHTSIGGYEDILSDDPAATGAYAGHVRRFLADRRIFFLAKGKPADSDSRDRTGLLAQLAVTPRQATAAAGSSVLVHLVAVNVGSARWLPSDAPAGPVLGGVHLYRGDGQLIDRDYRRVPLPHAGAAGTAPGQRVETDFELPVPAEPGHYTARLDLVAEQVCWFEVNGSQPAVIRLTVT